MDNNTSAFLALVRAGLWEQKVQLSPYALIDYKSIYRLAQEQAVLGFVAAGLEHVVDIKAPKEDVLIFVGETLQIEQRNKAMNYFINVIVEKMHNAGIYTLLVKGQGIAQCYERPLWRSCGDVDFLLDKDNYEKAKAFLTQIASSFETEDVGPLHQAFCIEPWEVELHGTLHGGLYGRMDSILDDIQKQLFDERLIRVWNNNGLEILLPRCDEDVVFIFSHLLQHFYKGGVGLRQVCDLCRLLWRYHADLDLGLLKRRLQSMGIMSEWIAFASLCVDYIGLPEVSMPFYSNSFRWHHKAELILNRLIKTGNFGHNKENNYFKKKTLIARKAYSFFRHTEDSFNLMLIFPLNSLRIWLNMVKTGVCAVLTIK